MAETEKLLHLQFHWGVISVVYTHLITMIWHLQTEFFMALTVMLLVSSCLHKMVSDIVPYVFMKLRLNIFSDVRGQLSFLCIGYIFYLCIGYMPMSNLLKVHKQDKRNTLNIVRSLVLSQREVSNLEDFLYPGLWVTPGTWGRVLILSFLHRITSGNLASSFKIQFQHL